MPTINQPETFHCGGIRNVDGKTERDFLEEKVDVVVTTGIIERTSRQIRDDKARRPYDKIPTHKTFQSIRCLYLEERKCQADSENPYNCPYC